MTDEQRQLAADNHNLIYSFLNHFGYDHEEYYDLAAIGLCKAAESWNPKRGMFSTYAYACMSNWIKNEIKSKNVAKRIPEELICSYNGSSVDGDDDLLEFIEAIPNNEDIERDGIDRFMMDLYLNRLGDLSDRDRQVFLLLLDGYSMREIGRILGCNHNSVAFIRRKIGSKLMGCE